MKILTKYRKNGFDFKQVDRVGNVMLAHGIGGSEDPSQTFEVIIVQSHDGRELHGNHYPPAEYPPSNEQWGMKGWTFMTMDGAIGKFDELVAKKAADDNDKADLI